MFRLNKKGQASDAVTWIVATIVVVVIMVFFVFGASILADTKDISGFKSSLFSTSENVGDDIFLKKNLFTYFVVEKEEFKKRIMSNLESRNGKGEFDFPLPDVQKHVFQRYSLSN